ncbi:FAD-dependent oxidoreductase [Jeotgalibacillus malaysiensis]|uniref:FAD-dependent oxidoreductase n=1 Tax=Jeotgalibacillus malaysiensis TaxID=1508404 RepID=UPI00384B22EA
MNQLTVDLIIIGGGLGGTAAAIAACAKGLRVYMSEPTDWIGGQVTSQGVPPDEHQWIEEFGRTLRYREYRESVRSTYKKIMNVTAEEKHLNPGNGLVSNICHDPRVSLQVLKEMILPYQLTGLLTVDYKTAPAETERTGRMLQSVVFRHVETDKYTQVSGKYVIDASEEGDLLPLAGMNYVTGAEAKSETGEEHARDVADPKDIQAFTYVLGIEYRDGEDHTIEKPEMYDFWKSFKPDFWPDQYLSFYAPHPQTKEKRTYTLFKEENGFPLWNYRRILHTGSFAQIEHAGEVTLMNWPMNDYFLGNVYEVSEEERKKHDYQAKQLSLSLLYWMQTELERADGKKGYPGLMLRKDIFETRDGLAKAPYIRESRRIKAEYTVTEDDVSPRVQPNQSGKQYEDSVGVGSYSIDLHPSIGGRNYLDIPALPFHIPLGALIPADMDNVIAGSKNIGTTHITNGCYRLHPVEWNIGESAGELAAFCIRTGHTPKEVRNDQSLLASFQQTLQNSGVELEWPESFYEKRRPEV